MNNIEYLESELSRLLDWIQAAETKISLVLTLSTAMLGALAVLSPVCSAWSTGAIIVASVSAALLVLSLFFSALASFPQTKGPDGSLIYFGGIASRDLGTYSGAVKELNKEQYIKDLTNQCHRNSQIAERKFTWVKRAMICLFLSSVPWAFSLFLLYKAKS